MRAAIYLRMSLDRELGIERQREDCTALCERMGWQGIEYVDLAKSATRGTRPAYQQLLRDIANGHIDTVICWRTDRLYRKLADLLPLIDLCQKHKIAVHTVQTGNIDLSTDAGQLQAQILGAVSENEGKVRTARQLRALEQVVQTGRGWGQTMFGYSEDHRKPGINEKEAQAVRKGYKDFLAGTTLYSIAKDWNDAGFKTRRGNYFTATTVRRILDNPRNAGWRTHRGEIVGKGDWPAIIDQETWEQTHVMLSKPARKTTDVVGGIRARKQLLGGILRCGTCGRGLGSAVNSRKIKVYKCKSSPQCKHPVVRQMQHMDDYVTHAVLQRLSERRWTAATEDDTRRAKELHAEAATLRERLDSLGLDYAEGNLNGAQMKVATERIEQKLEEVETQLRRVTKSRVFDGLEMVADLEAWWEDDLSLDRRRALIWALCDKIVVKPLGATGHAAAKLPIGHNVVIHWHQTGDGADAGELLVADGRRR